MAVTISASLVSAGSPQPVQIVVNGVPAGTAYTVVGSTGDGSRWPVPGGAGVSVGGQIVLVDNRSALSTPVTYVLTASGATYTSNVVTVAGRYVIQSLDGQTSVEFVWRDNGLPGEPTFASTTFDVPGRERPPVRFAPGGDGCGELDIRTNRENSDRLRALLKSGRPLVVRTDGAVRDFPAVELIQPMSGPNSLWPAMTSTGPSTDRVWTIRYLLVDDPEPSVALAAFTWDDFDAAMAGRTWSGLVTRRNYALNPRPVSATSWLFSATAGVISSATIGGADGPEGRTGYLRRTFTGSQTTANAGHYARWDGSMAGVAGDVIPTSIWVRNSVATTMRLSLSLRAGGAAVSGGNFVSPTTEVPANTWVRLAAEVAAPAAYDGLQVWAQVVDPGPLVAGVTADAGSLMIADSGAYFDGALPDAGGWDYGWAGAANASVSTATGLDPASFDGLFAASTWDDFDTYDWDQL